MRDGAPVMSFGVMGGNMQPQGQLQTLVRMLDYGQQPQAACDAPRWKWNSGLTVDVEPPWARAWPKDCARVAMSWKDWTTLTWTSAPASSSGVWATRPWTVMSAPATAGATAGRRLLIAPLLR